MDIRTKIGFLLFFLLIVGIFSYAFFADTWIGIIILILCFGCLGGAMLIEAIGGKS